MSLEILKEQLRPTYNKLVNATLKNDDIIFLSSIINILQYNPEENADKVPTSRIDDLINEKLDYFVQFIDNKSQYQVTGIDLHREYAIDSLKKMLNVDEEIVMALYQSGNPEEKRMIKHAYDKIADIVDK